MKLDTVLWKGKRCHQNMEDLWNYQEVLWIARPDTIIEVGPGEKGTLEFLKDLGIGNVISIDEMNVVNPAIRHAFIILDGDVYNFESMKKDLETYSPLADWLVVCHTCRQDWGSYPALVEWQDHKDKDFTEFSVPYMTRHTWLIRK
jgi:Cephalosporin hydroxylase